MKTAYVIILILTLLSFKLVDFKILNKNNINYRNTVQSTIVKGNDGFSLEYGMLAPAIIYAVQKVFNIPFNIYKSQLIASNVVNFFIFLLIFYLFYLYLKMFFNEGNSIIGLLLLASVVPFSLNGIYPESDFLNLLLFILGMVMILKSKIIFVPIIILIGMFNEMQISFLIVFFICYLISSGKVFSPLNLIIVLISIIISIAAYYIIDSRVGIFDLNISYNMSRNLENPGLILQLWSVTIAFIVLNIISFRSSQKLFKTGLFAVGIFLILIFFLGNFYDTGKFLPAYLILIPLALNNFKKLFT